MLLDLDIALASLVISVDRETEPHYNQSPTEENIIVTSTSAPRYDRIVSLIVIVLLGLAVVFLIDSNPNILRARLGGDLPTITVSWVLIASLVIIISAGADLLARAHPQMQTRTLPTINLGFASLELAP